MDGAVVSPMDVFQHEQQRTTARNTLEKLRALFENDALLNPRTRVLGFSSLGERSQLLELIGAASVSTRPLQQSRAIDEGVDERMVELLQNRGVGRRFARRRLLAAREA